MPRKSSRSFGQSLGLFLLINIIPIGLGVTLYILHLQGEIEIREMPAGFTTNLIVAGGALVLLFLVASLGLPAAHGVVKGIEGFQRRQGAILGGKEEGSKFLALLAMPLGFLGWLVAWPVRFFLLILSLALIAVVGIFLYRAWQPDFLQTQLDQILAWRP